MRALLAVILALLALAPLARAQADDPAVAAYRAGDHGSASQIWSEALEHAPSARERARLCYNLGNCAYRAGKLHLAIAWYTASRMLHPRGADLWRNLEHARAEAGLEPADRGDLDSTLSRLFSSLTLAESEWLVSLLAALLAACLAGEALRGRAFRRPALVLGVLLLVACVPWVWNLASRGRPSMVVAKDGAPARSEPSRTAKALAELAPGTIVERTDALPGWVEVRANDRAELWVREDALFDLAR